MNTKVTLEQITAKWTPLMMGISEQKETRLAWAFEQESNYLKSLSEEARQTSYSGDKIRFVFPVLRRSVERLEDDDNFARIYSTVSESVQIIAEAANEVDPSIIVSVESQTNLAAGLAERLQTSLQSFPG